ncbi:PAS domain-containing sensor histidine kinase [Siphonobacter sp. SORGH_AS_1065]|uniref:sensor histidine kinase n=1 Tax=Siphonobacter sp. SORGH_AS_1065 TaxID=3041795 RepID=UPI002780C68C|nr:ATP-binding protein [Siphonobacter sp. SORGH_AS_1065]MDQ1089888.1 two-component system nitrogen regulation sensor histidine kinase NtrY [Siphonobacter sp. SORGH_AS_1065]
MKLSNRLQYIFYITALHLLLMGLVYQLLFQNKALFIATEVILVLSIGVAIHLYQSFNQPIAFIRSGIEAIKDKDFTVKFVPTGKGEVDTLIEVYNLMIDQLREERTRLQEQHFFLDKLIEASPVSLLILDFDERIAVLNPVALQTFGTAVVGKKLENAENALLLQMSHMTDGESQILKTDGVQAYKVQRSHLMDQGFRRSFFMLEELTTELYKTEKAAYGKVIRMMAHEVNNTLGATDSILQTTLHSLPEPEFSDFIEALRVASQRNGRLSQFMRNFADVVRLPQPRKETMSLNALAEQVSVFMRASATAQAVTIHTPQSLEPCSLYADVAQLEQVLVNIYKNAIEADGSEIRTEIRAHELCIFNNGKPITSEESSQLFNPFYSSKSNGQGIGLTLIREILVNHGYNFTLKTQSNGWTVFRIEFAMV